MTISKVIQNPIKPKTDLRDMLRQHLVRRSLACMKASQKRRQAALKKGDVDGYCWTIRTAVQGFYGKLPVGRNGAPLQIVRVSSFEKNGYRIENVLFDSFPRWQVNATVYVPLDFKPPFPAVVMPLGHSDKQYENYQIPCQFFARAGYLTITFDPPGFGEKSSGNDHFTDGVRCYLTGDTSSKYFITDALRCIDYLGTRRDVDLSNGVAMTGSSGGGYTTILAGLLDERITVCGPSCGTAPLTDFLPQCYSGCPESHMWQRYSESIDEFDLLCAAVPKLILAMYGEKDEVLHIDFARRLAEEISCFYSKANVKKNFEFYIHSQGHGYTLDQARHFTAFMNKWLRKYPNRAIPDLPDDSFSLNPYEELRCYPRTDVNMYTLTKEKADNLAMAWDKEPSSIRQAARAIACVASSAKAPEAEEGEPFQVWAHQWQQVMLRPEKGIELPATFLYSIEGLPTSTLLHFDDKGRHRLLYSNRELTRTVRFTDTEKNFNLFTIDLRGWGDTAMAIYPYELAGWGGIDRFAAYTSAALGDHVMSMRIRDGLSALAYLRSRNEVNKDKIVVSGCGLGGIVALHIAAIDGNLGGVAIWDTLVSFRSLLSAEHYNWPADTFIPNVLKYYDLPELASGIPCVVHIFNALDGFGEPMPDNILEAMKQNLNANVFLRNMQWPAITTKIQQLLQGD